MEAEAIYVLTRLKLMKYLETKDKYIKLTYNELLDYTIKALKLIEQLKGRENNVDNIYIKTNELGSAEKYFANTDLVSLEDLLEKVDEIAYELDNLQEEFDDYKKDVEENATWRKPEEDYGWDTQDYI